MEKEKWIDEVENSFRGMRKAEPNPFLFTRIEQRIRAAGERVSAPKISLAFASLALLLMLNVLVITRSEKKSGGPKANEYSLNNINYHIY